MHRLRICGVLFWLFIYFKRSNSIHMRNKGHISKSFHQLLVLSAPEAQVQSERVEMQFIHRMRNTLTRQLIIVMYCHKQFLYENKTYVNARISVHYCHDYSLILWETLIVQFLNMNNTDVSQHIFLFHHQIHIWVVNRDIHFKLYQIFIEIN